MNKGIDYGLGKTNIDQKTGTRFSVISMNSIFEFWCSDSQPVYPENLTSEESECYEVTEYEFKNSEYECYSDQYNDVMILKSPFYTYAQFCSPCFPGGCHLDSPLDTIEPNNKCYCLGHDWFENGKAPYRVFNVSDNKEVF